MVRNNIEQGNVYQDRNKYQWLLGCFMDKGSLLFSKDVEIKWSDHKKGEIKKSHPKNSGTTTLCILIKGHVTILFSEENKFTLKKQGDYSIWSPNKWHLTEVIKDSIILTIRWPSLRDKKPN